MTEPGGQMAQGERGERGETGAPGRRGQRGPAARRIPPVIYMCAVNFVLFVILVIYVANAINRVSDAASSAQAAIASVNHLRAANLRVRCDAIAKEVSIPLPVPIKGNPSRVWTSQFEAIERVRGAESGCKLPPPRYAPESPGH